MKKTIIIFSILLVIGISSQAQEKLPFGQSPFVSSELNGSAQLGLISNQSTYVATYKRGERLTILEDKYDYDFNKIALVDSNGYLTAQHYNEIIFREKKDNRISQIDFCYHDFDLNGSPEIVFIKYYDKDSSHCEVYRETEANFEKIGRLKSNDKLCYVYDGQIIFFGSDSVMTDRYVLNRGKFISMEGKKLNFYEYYNYHQTIINPLLTKLLEESMDSFDSDEKTFQDKESTGGNNGCHFFKLNYGSEIVYKSWKTGMSTATGHLAKAQIISEYDRIYGLRIEIGQSKEELSYLLNEKISGDKVRIRGNQSWRGMFTLTFKDDKLFRLEYVATDLKCD